MASFDTDDDEEVADVAGRIRATYYEERQRFLGETRGTDSYLNNSPRHVTHWDGGTTRRGEHRKPIWPKIARQCISMGLVPEDLVRSLFLGWKGMDPPFPNQILSDRALNTYFKYQKQSAVLLESKVKAEMDWAMYQIALKAMNLEGTMAQIYHAVVLDPHHLSPVVRYVLAKAFVLPGLAEQLVRAAAEEYGRYPRQYDRVLGNYVDDYLKGLATQLRERS